MKLRNNACFASFLLMITVMLVSLVGCDKNDEPGIEAGENYQDYPWYVDPDTTRGEDGKLYFHYDSWWPNADGVTYSEPAFIEEVTQLSVEHMRNRTYNTLVFKGQENRWSFYCNIEGKRITALKNFSEFKECCLKYGLRPRWRTPYDADLQKMPGCPVFPGNKTTVLCQTITDISVITQTDFDASHPAGSDMTDILSFQADYLDDYVVWYNANKTEVQYNPQQYYLLGMTCPYNTCVRAPVAEYLKSPKQLIRFQDKYIWVFLGCDVVPEIGIYTFTITITFADGKKFTTDATLCVAKPLT